MNGPPIKGPSRVALVRSLPRLVRDPLRQFDDWNREYGDSVSIPVRTPPTLHLSHPNDLRHILSVAPHRYRKTGALIIGRSIIGNGLLASGEPLHTQQRNIVKPHFTRQAVDSFTSMMVDTATDHVSRWTPGSAVDIFPEMARLTISVIGKACFSTDLSSRTDDLYRDFGICQQFMQKLVYLPEAWPLPGNLRYRAAVKRLDATARELIRDRRSLRDRPSDLLTTLIEAVDTDGAPLDDDQIRDEIINILFAGHETTAIALAWTWYYLAMNPAIEQRLHAELHSALPHGIPTHETIGGLTYAGMVLNEAMRIRPPVWVIARIAIEDDELESGRIIPRGTEILMMPYLAHRNPLHFPDPERFDPERFDPERTRPHPYTFLPFGAGPRGCIGEAFARLEALIILAVTGKRFSLGLIPGQHVVPDPLVTLRPKKRILLRVHARHSRDRVAEAPAAASLPAGIDT